MAVNLARKNLLYDKLRFVITVAGVAFAVMLVITQMGLFEGLMSNSTITIQHMNADLWITPRNTSNVDFSNTFSEGRVDRVRSVPGVAHADNLIVWFAQIALPTGAKESLELYALEDFKRWGIPWNMVEGDPKLLSKGYYLILDDSATRRYGAFKVGDYREVNDIRWKIIGRSDGATSFTTTPLAFVDYTFAQKLAPSLLRSQTTYILVKLAPGADRDAVVRALKERLPYNDVWTSEAWAKRSRTYWIESTGLGLNLGVTVFLGCLVGIVIVAQTLYTSTMEHLKEFGTVKAIGGGNLEIYKILGEQALIAAVVGFTMGASLSFAMGPVVQKIGLKLLIAPQFLLVVFVGTVVLCLVSAMVSFRKVAQIDPALVFRT